MAEMNAVIGYVSDATAKAIGSKRQQAKPLEIRLERGSEAHVRVKPEDVAGVLVGASQKGETSVQVLLNDKATVETVIRGSASSFLKPIKDWTILPWRPPIVAIYVHPQYVDKLVALNRESAKKG